MRIGRIINNLQERLRINKLVQHDKKIDSFVTIHDDGFNKVNMRKVYQAKEVLANYAEQKGIHVDVFDKLPEAEALKHEGEAITKCIRREINYSGIKNAPQNFRQTIT